MKTQLFLIPLFLTVITIGQEPTFTYLSQNQFNRSNLDYYSPSELDENGCRETVTDHTALWLEIGTFDPELPDAEKETELAKLDKTIDELANTVLCSSIKTIVLSVGEAAFLRSTDKYKLYSKKYFKNYCLLNAERFWERYKSKFTTWFPGRSFVYVDWGW